MKRSCTWSLAALSAWLAGAGCAPLAGRSNNNANTAPPNANDNFNENDNAANSTMFDMELGVPNEGAAHVPVGQQVMHTANPPASGAHWSQAGFAPAPAGLYEETIEEERWVHNLEHGHIVLLYDCEDACTAEYLDALRSLFDDAPPSTVFGFAKLVMAPYDGLPGMVTAIAWDVQMHLESFDTEALLAFYERHLDQGPELAL